MQKTQDNHQTGNLSIRRATLDDAELLWKWANERSVRQHSFNPEPISWDSHLEWFAQRVNSPETRFYILLENGSPVGQIRYDRDHSEAEIGFSIAVEHRGKKFGIAILRLTGELALRDLNCKRLTALVIKGNEASRKAFIHAGFEFDGMTRVQNKTSYRFIWMPVGN